MRTSDLTTGRKTAIVVVVFTLLALTIGVTFYSTSVYLDRLPLERHFSVNEVSFGSTVASLSGGALGLLVARLLRRYRIVTLVVVGGVGELLGMAGIGVSVEVWGLWGSYLLLGSAGAFTGAVTLTELIARTFRPTPGPAIAVATSGMSIGGAFIPPIFAVTLDGLGLVVGSIATGVVLLLTSVIAALIIADPKPGGADEAAPDPATETAAAMPTGSVPVTTDTIALPAGPMALPPRRRLGATPTLVLLMVAFTLLVLSQNATMIHLLRFASDRGIGAGELALSVVAGTSFLARFAGIWVLRQMGIRWFALGIAVCQGAAQLIISLAYDPTMLFLGSVLLGITVGNVFVLASLFVLAGFPLQEYAGRFSIVNLATTVGSAFGPLVMALGYTAFGDYTLPTQAVGIASLIGGVLLVLTGVDTDPKAERAERERTRRTGAARPSEP